MTPLPNPPSPTLRLQMYWSTPSGEFGSRIFVTYSGGPPSVADCTALAGDLSTAWSAHLAASANDEVYLVRTVCTDITSPTGAQGIWTGGFEGTAGAGTVPVNACADIGFLIARRYRGGKPRIYLPPGAPTDLLNDQQWTGAFTTALNTAWGGFISAVLASTSGTTVLVAQVNLGYYSGVEPPVTLPSGRVKQASMKLTVPHSDPITGHVARTIIGSQRRRLNSLT